MSEKRKQPAQFLSPGEKVAAESAIGGMIGVPDLPYIEKRAVGMRERSPVERALLLSTWGITRQYNTGRFSVYGLLPGHLLLVVGKLLWSIGDIRIRGRLSWELADFWNAEERHPWPPSLRSRQSLTETQRAVLHYAAVLGGDLSHDPLVLDILRMPLPCCNNRSEGS